MELIANLTFWRWTIVPDIVEIHRGLGALSVTRIQCSSDLVPMIKRHFLVSKQFGLQPLRLRPSILTLVLVVKTATSHSLLVAEDTRVVPILIAMRGYTAQME